MNLKTARALLLGLLVGCGAEGTTDAGSTTDAGQLSTGLDPSYFVTDGLAVGSTITQESCTLSGGTVSTCYRITTRGTPDHTVGPFCPRSITDGADAGGLWFENKKPWDLSGPFIANLATFYNDNQWLLYEPSTGLVRYTKTQTECAAAARPNVDPAFNNYCVECLLSYVNGGIGTTYLIPVTPVPLATAAEVGRMGVVGVALNGIRFDPPAPTAAILAAHTIAAFDDCGGHVNLNEGYHYHGTNGCSKQVAQADGHAPLIGYALDGYGVHAMVNEDGNEPGDLDVCRGHTDGRGYHYHVAGLGENLFIGCFHGQQGSSR